MRFQQHWNEQAKKTADEHKQISDRLGSALLNIGYTVLYLICLSSLMTTEPHWFRLWVGLWSLFYSWRFRERALAALGANYSHEVAIREQHQLVVQGLYAKVRHPLYAGLLLDTWGAAVLADNRWGWLVWLGFTMVVLRRLSIEDRALVEKFGDPAVSYHLEVPALRLFC
jgi:protein-S-isoprenylcysteine O-methyltransferase Ste14